MTIKTLTTGIALVLLAGAASVSASPEKKGDFHGLKECSEYNFAAGGFCTFTSSNLAEIPAGTKVYYDQAAGVPSGMLDSNVILDAGHGNRAVGRCTVAFNTGLGLCVIADGLGDFAGFSARINVRIDFPSGITYWDGTYSFDKVK
jgi:hypothetical protein